MLLNVQAQQRIKTESYNFNTYIRNRLNGILRQLGLFLPNACLYKLLLRMYIYIYELDIPTIYIGIT